MDPLSTLASLSGAIEEAKATRKLGFSISAAIQAATQAQPALERLRHMNGFVALTAPTLSSDERQALKAHLRTLRATGMAIAESNDAVAVQEVTRLLTQDLARDTSSIQAALSAGWKRLIEREFGVTGRLGRVLNQLPETKVLGSKMILLHQKAEALSNSLETAQRLKKEFTQLQKAKDEANASLKQLGTGVDVIAFLLAVANQQATVGNLTPQVRSWLTERQALDLFKISL